MYKAESIALKRSGTVITLIEGTTEKINAASYVYGLAGMRRGTHLIYSLPGNPLL